MFCAKFKLLFCLAFLAGCQSNEVNFGGPEDRHESSQVTSSIAKSSDTGNGSSESPDDGNAQVAGLASSGSETVSKIVIGNYRPPKAGTVFYWKNNWNSLPPKLVQRVSAQDVEFAGKKAIAMESIEETGNSTTAFYDVTTSNMLGHKDKNGKPVLVFSKVEERLRFPMKPGDQWVTNWKTKDYSTGKTTSGGGIVKVVGPEKLKVAGNMLKTMKIQLPVPKNTGRGMKHFIWYSPKFGIVVREQVANGTFVWLKQLEKVKLPG